MIGFRKMSIFFVNSSLEAVFHLIYKALLTQYKIKQNYTTAFFRIFGQRAKIRPV